MNKVLVKNRRARHDYAIESTIEAGIQLHGTEVKAIRLGRAQLQDAWVNIRNGEAWLVGSHVGEYPHARHFVHEARRDRRLLLHAEETKKLQRKIQEKGFTLIPLDLHLSERGFIKVLLGLGRGKTRGDKRETIKKRDQEREIRRALRDRR